MSDVVLVGVLRCPVAKATRVTTFDICAVYTENDRTIVEELELSVVNFRLASQTATDPNDTDPPSIPRIVVYDEEGEIREVFESYT